MLLFKLDPKWTSGNELEYLKQVLSNSEEDVQVDLMVNWRNFYYE